MVNIKILILAFVFLATFVTYIGVTPWGYMEMVPFSFQPEPGARIPESGIGDIGIEIFTIYVFPFEVLALVLLAALIGAIYVARKEAAR
jgi:NADH:ubiquinone oxidoreductase subunit 6 (subunit J)